MLALASLFGVEDFLICIIFYSGLFPILMGNKQSQQHKQIAIQINHPRFWKSKILRKENQAFLQTTQPIDEKEYDKWQAAIKAKYQSTIPSNLLLPRSQSFERAGLCGNTGIMTANYDNHPYLLSEYIYNRKGLKSVFSQEEIWFLLYSLTEARNQAESAGQKLGDIRPKNIFLSEGVKIKVSNSLSWPQEVSNIQKSFDMSPTYLAPQDLDKLRVGQAKDRPTQESQAFSIGLTILSCGNLMEYEDLYDLKAFELDVVRFHESLGMWAKNNGYSLVLRGTMLLLLNMQPDKRLSCTQLNELLAKHAESILKKQNFVIDNAPAKLHEQIQHLLSVLNPIVKSYDILPTLIASQQRLNLPNYELAQTQQQQISQ